MIFWGENCRKTFLYFVAPQDMAATSSGNNKGLQLFLDF
jgi:hypothetical protein